MGGTHLCAWREGCVWDVCARVHAFFFFSFPPCCCGESWIWGIFPQETASLLVRTGCSSKPIRGMSCLERTSWWPEGHSAEKWVRERTPPQIQSEPQQESEAGLPASPFCGPMVSVGAAVLPLHWDSCVCGEQAGGCLWWGLVVPRRS